MANVCGACGTIRPLENDPDRHESVELDGVPYIRCHREDALGVRLDA